MDLACNIFCPYCVHENKQHLGKDFLRFVTQNQFFPAIVVVAGFPKIAPMSRSMGRKVLVVDLIGYRSLFYWQPPQVAQKQLQIKKSSLPSN